MQQRRSDTEFSFAELFKYPGCAKKHRDIYFDPETGRTWSGLGREPRWIKGKNREDFKLRKPDALER